jgi:hypothetical protein
MRFIKYCEISILKLAPELGIHNVGNKTGMSFFPNKLLDGILSWYHWKTMFPVKFVQAM